MESGRKEPRALRRGSRGQSMVVLTIAMVSLLGASAFCTDVGVIFYNWELLQKAVDAAALAGAHYLPVDPGQAVTSATNYAELNGVASTELIPAPQVSQNANGMSVITVSATRQVPYFFGRVVNLTSATVRAQAEAGVEYVSAASDFIPIGLSCSPTPDAACGTNDPGCTYPDGTTVTLKEGSVGPGNWSPLSLSSTGGAVYRTQLDYGYQGPAITVGSALNLTTQPGNLVGPTVQGIDDRLSRSAYGDGPPPSGFNPTDSRMVCVPLVDFCTAQGRSQVTLTGFAAMWIESVSGGGDIQAEFLQQVDACSGTPGSTTPPIGASGASAPILLE